MRVVTANLQHGVPDPVGRARLGLAEEPLRGLGGGVYGLQELDHRRVRTGFADQGRQLARALGGELVSALAKRMELGGQANALIVRGEVVEREVVVLPGGGERRVLVLAVVVVDGGRWTIGTTHLSLGEPTARRQLATALGSLTTRPSPWILAGDLNLSAPDVAPVAAEHGFDLIEGPPTHSARRTPDRRLDHVLTKGCTVTASGVEKLPVSDHLAVWADVAT